MHCNNNSVFYGWYVQSMYLKIRLVDIMIQQIENGKCVVLKIQQRCICGTFFRITYPLPSADVYGNTFPNYRRMRRLILQCAYSKVLFCSNYALHWMFCVQLRILRQSPKGYFNGKSRRPKGALKLFIQMVFPQYILPNQ